MSDHHVKTLHDSVLETESGTNPEFQVGKWSKILFALHVETTAAGVEDWLDIYVDVRFDFPLVAGVGPGSIVDVGVDLAAGDIRRGFMGSTNCAIRCRHVINDGGTQGDAEFQYHLHAVISSAQ